jgi:hypothetical protein
MGRISRFTTVENCSILRKFSDESERYEETIAFKWSFVNEFKGCSLRSPLYLDLLISTGHTLPTIRGRVAELVDALVSGTSDRKIMRVRVSLRPPYTSSRTTGVLLYPF